MDIFFVSKEEKRETEWKWKQEHILSIRLPPQNEPNVGSANAQGAENQGAQLVVAALLSKVVHGKADGQVSRPKQAREAEGALVVCRLGVAQGCDAKERSCAMRGKGGEGAENDPARCHAETERVPRCRGEGREAHVVEMVKW